jgi:hypothetical protein
LERKQMLILQKNFIWIIKNRFSFQKSGQILMSASGTLKNCSLWWRPAYFQIQILWLIIMKRNDTNSSFYFTSIRIECWFWRRHDTRLYNSIVAMLNLIDPLSQNNKKPYSFLGSVKKYSNCPAKDY